MRNQKITPEIMDFVNADANMQNAALMMNRLKKTAGKNSEVCALIDDAVRSVEDALNKLAQARSIHSMPQIGY